MVNKPYEVKQITDKLSMGNSVRFYMNKSSLVIDLWKVQRVNVCVGSCGVEKALQ